METGFLLRAITPMLRRRGNFGALEGQLEAMPVEALSDLLRLLRAAEEAEDRERRTFRPFPGGPRIRM